MVERREYPRLDDFLSVNYRVLGRDDSSINALCQNISAGGICFSAGEGIQQETLLEVGIYIKKINKSIQTKGSVVWSQRREDKSYPYIVGVKFTEIEDCERDFILHYVWKVLREKE
ncbi:MAG: PilZ domain-containing protein [Candidatus Kaelpia aquatica]|nr:PilZ domain-containing protein [Candidatus Kaelpia aquatica]